MTGASMARVEKLELERVSAEEGAALIAKLKAAQPLSESESRTAADLIEGWQYVVMLAEQGKLGRPIARLLSISHQRDGRGGTTQGKDQDSTAGSSGNAPSAQSSGPAGSADTGAEQTSLVDDTSEERPKPPKADEEQPVAGTAADACGPGDADTAKKRDSHGRRGWDDFPELAQQHLAHTELQSGCQCPSCQRGRLYACKPARLVVIAGQAPLAGNRYVAERLQCNLCKAVFTATNDELERDGADGRRLYTYSAAAAVCIIKYFAGMPWFRQEFLQVAVGVAVPDASMADLCERIAEIIAPVFRYLMMLSRSAQLLLGDDTSALILELRQAVRTRRGSTKEVERTGCHVTCIIAQTVDGRRIVLFRVGIQHTGELADKVLEGRDPTLPPPLFMGDCHAANTVTVCHTIHGGCNAHAVRRFKEIKDRYPVEAGYALKRYEKIFANDAHCKDAGLDDQQRLEFHVQHSKPLFDEICTYGQSLLDHKQVEPNSDIAKAYNYVLNNRVRLSAFLRHPGMPLHNNDSEQILRLPVRLRDNAPFFKNAVGAAWAQTIWTVGVTALAHDVNLLDYFQCAQRYSRDLKQNPDRWVPWAYRDRVVELEDKPSTTYRSAANRSPPAPQHRSSYPFRPPPASTRSATFGSSRPPPEERAAGVGQASR